MKVLAHPISASRSELRVDNGLTRLEIHLPMAELDHVPQSQRLLPDQFRVNNELPISKSCEFAGDDYVCKATFLVPTPKTVTCNLASVVVPHHVHTMQTPEGALVFTNLAIEQQIQHRSAPWWLLGVLVLLIAISIRQWRRRTSARG